MHRFFISYSHKDEEWKDCLVTHLSVLAQEGHVDIWDDRRIEAGNDWFPEIQQAMEQAHVAFLLISAHFLTSNFIRKEEIPRLLQRRAEEGLRVIPLIVKPCAWKQTGWLSKMQARPKDGRALSLVKECQVDSDLAALTEEIAGMLKGAEATTAPGMPRPTPPECVSLAKLPTTGGKFIGRKKEMETLDVAWEDPQTHVLSFVAMGGAGKTSLVRRWLDAMQKANFKGAEKVFGWSFYSQGTSEDRQASSDEFLAQALTFFGDTDPTKGKPWDKGVRLGKLVRDHHSLLILDGLEPLQHPPAMGGMLKDQGMQALLKDLARSPWIGLCVMSTRERVADLEGMDATTWKNLDDLGKKGGANLLSLLGAKGPENELQQAATEFGCHALALTLLGNYLAVVHEGDIRKRDLVPALTEIEELGGHARRVMESYEKWLAEDGMPELDILYLMGLFDRPAPGEAIKVLTKRIPITGLTENLVRLPKPKWHFAVDHLRKLGLLAPVDKDEPDKLDCHPLVRAHFGAKLHNEKFKAWQTAHSRLYEYYRGVPIQKYGKYLPDTLEEMEPLFLAVAHGCKAGRYQEAGEKVFFSRILRNRDGYSIKKLGTFNATLAALSHFFEQPWDRPSSVLPKVAKAAVSGCAGLCLRALGRLREALDPMQTGLELSVQQQDWENAAHGANNLSDLSLALGEVGRAVEYGQEAVEHADKSEKAFIGFAFRAAWADALHQAGHIARAEELFREAETMQQNEQQQFTYLYSVQGFRFCDLLLAQGQYAEAHERAEQALIVAQRNEWLLDIGLDALSLGRATLAQIQAEGSKDLIKAAKRFNQAVEGLRQAGQQDYLCRGLLARAELFRATGDYQKAWDDLNETFDLADRSGMRLHLTDYHLEAARLCLAEAESLEATDKPLAQKKRQDAQEHLDQAATLVNETGYHRRDKEVAELQEKLAQA